MNLLYWWVLLLLGWMWSWMPPTVVVMASTTTSIHNNNRKSSSLRHATLKQHPQPPTTTSRLYHHHPLPSPPSYPTPRHDQMELLWTPDYGIGTLIKNEEDDSDTTTVADAKIAQDTKALQDLLDMPSQWHKQVVIPEGYTVVTFPLNISSDTTLQVDGTLRATTAMDQWPILPPLAIYGDSEDRNGAWLANQFQAFLYVVNATNVRITGVGTVDGSGQVWWQAFKNRTLTAGRPNLYQSLNASQLEIDSVTFKDSGFWTVHPILSRQIHIHHMKIRAHMYAPNVDGIDPDSCRDVLIEYNDVACGDDHIAIKAGLCGPPTNKSNRFGNVCTASEIWKSGKLMTKNVTVRHNLFRTGMGIAVGSETSGSIHDVYIYNNTIGLCEAGYEHPLTSCGWGPALHLKTTITRSGVIDNVIFDSNIIYNNTQVISMETNYQIVNQTVPPGYPVTKVQNIVFQNNIAMGSAVGASFGCDVQDPCHNITVVNNTLVTAAAQHQNPWGCKYIQSYHVTDNSPPGLEECMANSMHPHMDDEKKVEKEKGDAASNVDNKMEPSTVSAY